MPVPDSGGVMVTCIEANHCPGSCLFLFEGPQTSQLLSRNHASPYIGTGKIFRYLHCGDFRASPVHTNHPSIIGKKLDIIYLDTTYCNPRYCFPAQDQVIEACAELVRQIVPEEQLQANRAAAKLEQEGQLEPEDWRQAAPRRVKNKVDPDSASANAFKGWFQTKMENPDGTFSPLPLPPPPDNNDASVKKEEDLGTSSVKQEETRKKISNTTTMISSLASRMARVRQTRTVPTRLPRPRPSLRHRASSSNLLRTLCSTLPAMRSRQSRDRH